MSTTRAMTNEVAKAIANESYSLHDRDVAKTYNVSQKAVNRLRAGKTYSHITGIEGGPFKLYTDEIKVLLSLDGDSDVVRNYFALDLGVPLRWGMYDTPTGLGYLITDGFIAWTSKELCLWGMKLGGKEMPWRTASRIVSGVTGEIYRGILDDRYVRLASEKRLDIRMLEDEEMPYLYLTHSIPAPHDDPQLRVWGVLGL